MVAEQSVDFHCGFPHRCRKNALKATKEGLRSEMRGIEEANQDEIRVMKELQAKELVTLRLDFDSSMSELASKYEKRLEELKEDLELRRKVRTLTVSRWEFQCAVKVIFIWALIARNADGDSRNRRTQESAH